MNEKQITKIKENAKCLYIAACDPQPVYETLLSQTNSLWLKTIYILRTLIVLNNQCPTAADITTHYLEQYDHITNRVVRDTLHALTDTPYVIKKGHCYCVPSELLL